jgi:hypothetical protein
VGCRLLWELTIIHGPTNKSRHGNALPKFLGSLLQDITDYLELSLTNGCHTSASPAPPDVPGTRNTATVTASAMATPMATPTCFLVPADRFTTNQYRDKGVAQPTSSSRD